MTDKSAFYAVLLGGLLGASSVAMASETDPGGSGVLRRGGVERECFAATALHVTQVCGTLQIRWKLWTLMGEPVGDYALVWQLDNVSLRPARTKGNGTSHTLGELPQALADAAAKAELAVKGIAFLEAFPATIKANRVALAFDTGVAVRGNGQASMNVPSGYGWDTFLLRANAPSKSWCEPQGRQYASAQDAKSIMIAGVKLRQFELCKPVTVDASALDEAVARLCESDNQGQYAFCGKSEAKSRAAEPDRSSMDDVLDRVADKPALEKKAREHLQAARAAALEQCTERYAPVAACLAKAQCGQASAAVSAECKAIPTRPGDLMKQSCPEKGGLCLPYYADNGGKAWDRQWGDLALQCANEKKALTSACDASVISRCNPQNLNIEACVGAKMAKTSSAPAAKSSASHEPAKSAEKPSPFLD